MAAKYQWYEVYVPGTILGWIPAANEEKAKDLALQQWPEYKKKDLKTKVKN